MIKIFSKKVEEDIAITQKYMQNSMANFQRKYSEEEIDIATDSLTKRLNSKLLRLKKEPAQKKFYRRVCINFFPNTRSATGDRLFLSKSFLETGKEKKKNSWFTSIVSILKNLGNKKEVLPPTPEQLKYREMFVARLLVANKIGWEKVYTEEHFRRVVNMNNLSEEDRLKLEEFITDKKKNGKFVKHSKEKLIRDYSKVIKEEHAKELYDWIFDKGAER